MATQRGHGRAPPFSPEALSSWLIGSLVTTRGSTKEKQRAKEGNTALIINARQDTLPLLPLLAFFSLQTLKCQEKMCQVRKKNKTRSDKTVKCHKVKSSS